MRKNTQIPENVENEHELESLAFRATLSPLAISRYRVIINCNEALSELFGYEHDVLLKSSFAMLFPTYDDFASRGKKILEKMQQDPQYADERMMMRCDKTVFWCAVRGVTLTPDDPFRLVVWNMEEIPRCAPNAGGLSPREREVAAFIGEGLTSKEIGLQLNLSHRTIERHRARLMRKLGAPNAAALVAQIISLSRNMS